MSTVLEVPRVEAGSRVAEERHASLRLWLQLFSCTATIERHVRERLRERFDITLPRFDMMAQLDREPKGLKMSELSRRLMVTGGNVTGLTDQLVSEGLVVRRGIPGDRRAYNVRLTPKGKRQFDAMAAEHEAWIVALLADVPLEDRIGLHAALVELKAAIAARLSGHDGGTVAADVS
jgi:DNA-binding MarR family transcriptional regulator